MAEAAGHFLEGNCILFQEDVWVSERFEVVGHVFEMIRFIDNSELTNFAFVQFRNILNYLLASKAKSNNHNFFTEVWIDVRCNV